MRVDYTCIKTTWSIMSKRVVMAAGLLVLPITAKLEKSASTKPVPTNTPDRPIDSHLPTLRTVDLRTTRLRRFFTMLHCPVLSLAEDFVQAADDNHLDWRLLPSISVVESGGGKAYRNNNLFGWNNGTQAFPTVRAGLNTVAFKLGKSALYRNHDLLGKLRLYNPDDTYPGKVLDVMNQISPVAELNASRRLVRRRNEYVYVAN